MPPATMTTERHPEADSKGVSILARSLFRNMTDQGYSKDQIIGLSSELLHLVHEDLRRASGAELAAE